MNNSADAIIGIRKSFVCRCLQRCFLGVNPVLTFSRCYVVKKQMESSVKNNKSTLFSNIEKFVRHYDVFAKHEEMCFAV